MGMITIQTKRTNKRTETHAGDLISRKDAIRIVDSIDTWQAGWRDNAIESLKAMSSAQPERKTGRWDRLMMYLADLQLTYSPNWGANGCGDEKLYKFLTGLIEELEGWDAQPEIKPIEYRDCANAMLRMWMDNVVTDGEYKRIMDKLNAHWEMENE